MLKEFRKFILRGNVVDLAVAVVVGAAFNAVVQSLVKDFITPIVQGFTGKNGNLFAGQVTIAHRFVLNWGDFVSSLISFLIIAAVVFFLVVQPLNKLSSIASLEKDTEEPTTKKCSFCYSEISIKATRCPKCTSHLETKKKQN